MIKINDNIEFDETKTLKKQSKEFQLWFIENIFSQIKDTLKPIEYDSVLRPKTYYVSSSEVSFLIEPLYIYQEGNNWAVSDYNLKMN